MIIGESIPTPVNRQVPLLFLRLQLKLPQSCASTSLGSSSGSAALAVLQADTENLLSPAASQKQPAGLRLVPMLLTACPERQEWQGALVTHDQVRTVPFPHPSSAARPATSAACPVCPRWTASSMLTSPSVAESFPAASKGLQHLIRFMVEVSLQQSDPWGCYSYKHSYSQLLFSFPPL